MIKHKKINKHNIQFIVYYAHKHQIIMSTGRDADSTATFVAGVHIEAATAEKACIVCGDVYREIDNTGTWKCRQHSGIIRDGRFSCCNMKTMYTTINDFYTNTPSHDRKGCIRADHRMTYAAFNDDNGIVPVPMRWVGLMKERRHALTLRMVGKDKVLFVCRFDVETQKNKKFAVDMHELALNNMASPSYILKKDLLLT